MGQEILISVVVLLALGAVGVIALDYLSKFARRSVERERAREAEVREHENIP